MKVQSDYVLLSIQSDHATAIYRGDKKAELRKSFTSQAKVVFLYETAPVSAVTGAFIVRESFKTSVTEAAKIAQQCGVPEDRALLYYGDRQNGWVIAISFAIKFGEPIPIADLRTRDHYFLPPQSFLYLSKYEGLTQDLIAVLRSHLHNSLKLRALSAARRESISSLIRAEIGSNYEDIDDDFVHQVMDERAGADAAFSTVQKRVLEFVRGDELIGFTVVTIKQHGAWKTGPSVLLPHYRGIFLGQELRQVVESYCKREGARSIYCTCSSSQPSVVSYLLNSGMQLQARLKGHLGRDRDELVFSKGLIVSREFVIPQLKYRPVHLPFSVTRILGSDQLTRKTLNFFLRHLPAWYFRPSPDLYNNIFDSLKTFEAGITAFSAKGRAMYGCFDSTNRLIAAAVITPKRSEMLKINLVSTTRDLHALKRLISAVLKDFSYFRRIYITVPTNQLSAIQVLSALGFHFEGILQEPFSAGIDHACFGREVVATGRGITCTSGTLGE